MQKEGQKATRGLFLEPIRRVVSQVHAVLTISNEAVNFLDLQVCSPFFFFFFSSLSSNIENFLPTQLFQLLEKLCSSKFTTVEEIRDVVTAALPEDIAAWAIKEGNQVLIFTSSSPRLILILTPSSFCPPPTSRRLLRHLTNSSPLDQ